MTAKTFSSSEIRRMSLKPGECFYNVSKLGGVNRWIVTTWAALGHKPKAERTAAK